MNSIKKVFKRLSLVHIIYFYCNESHLVKGLSVPDPFISDLTILLNVSSQILERKKQRRLRWTTECITKLATGITECEIIIFHKVN